MINELGIKNNTNNNTKNTYQNMTNKPKHSMLSIRNKCKLKQRCGLADTYVLDTSDALDPPLCPSTSSHYHQMVSSPFPKYLTWVFEIFYEKVGWCHFDENLGVALQLFWLFKLLRYLSLLLIRSININRLNQYALLILEIYTLRLHVTNSWKFYVRILVLHLKRDRRVYIAECSSRACFLNRSLSLEKPTLLPR